MTMTLNFKLPYSSLRKAKAKELLAGGVWYLKKSENNFETVVSDIDSISDIMDYRNFINYCSKCGLIYLREDKPNYPLTLSQEVFIKQKILYYEKQKMATKQRN